MQMWIVNMNKLNKYVYMGDVLNKSSQEPPLSQIFRESFASFRGPIRVAFSKNKNSYQESNIWNQIQTRIQTIQYIGCCLHE